MLRPFFTRISAAVINEILALKYGLILIEQQENPE